MSMILKISVRPENSAAIRNVQKKDYPFLSNLKILIACTHQQPNQEHERGF